MLARLIASVFAGEVGEIIGRARAAAVLYVLAALAALCGFGFFIAAAYIAVAEAAGSLLAAIYFGAGFLVLALVLLVWQRAAVRLRVRRSRRRRAADVSAIASAAAIALLPSLLGRRTAVLGLLAPFLAAVGYAIYRENLKSDEDKPEEPED